jgi:hypothetical protein
MISQVLEGDKNLGYVVDNTGFRTAKKPVLQGRNPNHKRKRQSQF